MLRILQLVSGLYLFALGAFQPAGSREIDQFLKLHPSEKAVQGFLAEQKSGKVDGNEVQLMISEFSDSRTIIAEQTLVLTDGRRTSYRNVWNWAKQGGGKYAKAFDRKGMADLQKLEAALPAGDGNRPEVFGTIVVTYRTSYGLQSRVYGEKTAPAEYRRLREFVRPHG
jgi:hypothetical protein